MFRATALAYSSHNRSEYIHRDWIVERALKSHNNKTIFYVPFSMGRYDQQEYTWSTFKWFFDNFRQWGLDASTFFWTDSLSKNDADIFFGKLRDSEVVILGGGSTILGMERFRALGEHFYGDKDLFGRILHERQKEGKLTVGFSAGADQVAKYIANAFDFDGIDPYGFNLIANVVLTLHHEYGREGHLAYIARSAANCMVFGLPNDSGVACDQGYLQSGNVWQILEFIIDNSWDKSEDQWHIKTKSGMKIDHFYNDGRHWAFNGGDMMIRVMSPDGNYNGAWIKKANEGITDYWTQEWSGYHSIEHILASH